jgi:hypothetical protein
MSPERVESRTRTAWIATSVWCLIKSRYYSLSNVELLSGWHAPESAEWRWTEQRFSARMEAGKPARIELRVFVPQALIERYGPATLHATANGSPLPSQTYHESARFTYRATRDKTPSAGATVQLDSWLDHALPPSDSDERELGIVVAGLDAAPLRLGGLRQTGIRRPEEGLTLSRPLYVSDRHLQLAEKNPSICKIRRFHDLRTCAWMVLNVEDGGCYEQVTFVSYS